MEYKLIQGMNNAKKSLLLVGFFIISLFISAAPTNFLPMEDGLSPVRHSVYGASIDNIKPYRQPTPIEEDDSLKASLFDFDKTDVVICVVLLGIYVLFSQKRTKSRGAGF